MTHANRNILTTVEFNVTLEVEHPADLDVQHIRLAARGALRQELLRVNNSERGFDQHPYNRNESVAIALGTVEFE